MEIALLGKTGLKVSRLGLGLSELGYSLSAEETDRASALLNCALDHGINFLDTAECYGTSEEMIGKTVSNRRDEFVLSTKAGHSNNGSALRDWSAETIHQNIEHSLTRMKTDYLDIVHLHSCGLEVLRRGDVIRALQDARQAGKTRFIGYSGDNEAAVWAVESGLFDTLQTSFNLVDQWARIDLFRKVRAKQMGLIAKRPIANASWDAVESPSVYAGDYYRRAMVMIGSRSIPMAPKDPIALALGFTLAHEDIDTAIVGTSRPDHLLSNIRTIEDELPIDPEVVKTLHVRFERVGSNWEQLS